MLITKIISIGLDIQNTVNVYSDLEANVRGILIDRYEGRCLRAGYIQKINKIIKMSDCRINQDGNPTFGTIDVIFEVSAVIYAIGEVINGCEVINKDKRIIICSTPITSIMLNADESLESVRKGQKISVRVGGAKYNIGAQRISINAIPYMFITSTTIYQISSSDNKLYLQPMLERVQKEESDIDALRKSNPKAWEFFSQLLYAYKDAQKAPAGAAEFNLLNIINDFPKDIKYLSRDSKLNLFEPLVYGYRNHADFPLGVKLKSNIVAKEVLLSLLDDYYNQLRIIREMIEIYDSEGMLEKHKNLWLIFKKAKI